MGTSEPLMECMRQIAASIPKGLTKEQKDEALTEIMRNFAFTLGDMLAFQSGGKKTFNDFVNIMTEGFLQAKEGEQ